MIKELLEKYRRKKEVEEGYMDEDRITHRIQERKKNANERELERYYEEERQERIKKELDGFRKKRHHKIMTESKVLDNNKKMLKSKNIFKQKNIFKDKRANKINGESHWRW